MSIGLETFGCRDTVGTGHRFAIAHDALHVVRAMVGEGDEDLVDVSGGSFNGILVGDKEIAAVGVGAVGWFNGIEQPLVGGTRHDGGEKGMFECRRDGLPIAFVVDSDGCL
jgi:hypothetical protein